MTAFHLVTDLDGTWIPGEGEVDQLRMLENAIRSNPANVLTFATARSFESAWEVMQAWGLAEPDHLITDVGCALWHRSALGGFVEDLSYAAMIQTRWNEAAAHRVWVWEGLPSCRRAPGDLPLRHLTMEVAEGFSLDQAAHELADTLQAHGLQGDVLTSQGRFLDVLPPGVDKGFAIRVLQAAFPLPGPLICCGDSARDIGMLQIADHPILMGDGFITFDAPGIPRERAYRTPHRGPVGIHGALLALGLLSPSPSLDRGA